MPFPNIITIDGPAASGKSSIAKKVADALGYLFFDTGVMYRAVTWLALDRSISIGNEAEITTLAEASDIDVCPASIADGRNCDILINGQDITWLIRSPEVDDNVSAVSAYPGVRRSLTAQQRKIGQRGRVVMAGRDIGTVVLPEAELKIYLDASVEERSRRRYRELVQRGQPADLSEIAESLRRRDQIDSTRTFSPLHPADDAIIINTDHLNIDQVFDFIMGLIDKNS